MSQKLLSVCLITYNQDKYIRQAIESILMQRVNFQWSLIIADDFSTDGTRDIILEYKDKYPTLITLIFQEKNVGAARNWQDLILAPSSKYIAYFEGDDYWIDPLKLQKQVSFLESNEEYSLCFHNTIVKNLIDDRKITFRNLDKKIYSTRDVILRKWFCPSASILFRRTAINNKLINENIKNGDLLLLFILSLSGPLYYIDEVMSVYRYGIPGSMSVKYKLKEKNVLYKNLLNSLSYMNKISHNKYIIYILLKKAYIFLAMLKNIFHK